MAATSSLPSVGFVVIGRNEGERLVACLRSILPHTDRIVYADSASTDGSRERAEALGVRTLRLDPSMPTSAARGRHEGLCLLQQLYPECRYVHFVDGDCVLDPRWPAKALAFLESHPDVAAVCGRRYERSPELSFYNWYMDREWNTPVGQAAACGGDALFRIAAYDAVGGFRTDLKAGEEPELCTRLREAGWTIWRLDLPMTEHDARMLRFSQWWGRAERSGYGYAQAWRATRNCSEPLYARELVHAFGWTVGLPVIALLLCLLVDGAWPLLILPAAYGAQVARIAARGDLGSMKSWRSAAHILLGQAAIAKGAAAAFTARGQTNAFDYRRLGSEDARGGAA
jgi:GT2 family glycosyltransferase